MFSNSLLHSNVGRPAKTYIHQLWTDYGCHLEVLPRAIMIGTDGKKEFKESVLSAHIDNDNWAKKTSTGYTMMNQ